MKIALISFSNDKTVKVFLFFLLLQSVLREINLPTSRWSINLRGAVRWRPEWQWWFSGSVVACVWYARINGGKTVSLRTQFIFGARMRPNGTGKPVKQKQRRRRRRRRRNERWPTATLSARRTCSASTESVENGRLIKHWTCFFQNRYSQCRHGKVSLLVNSVPVR